MIFFFKKSLVVFGVFLFTIYHLPITNHQLLITRSVFAQSKDTRKTMEIVKEKIDTLVEAKDENNLDNLNLKISALKRVIELSVSEAKDLKIKILSVNFAEKNKESEAILKWREKVLASLDKTIAYYESQAQILEKNDAISNEEIIKSFAENLKNWREKNYLPLDNEIRDFLLTVQESYAIAVTKNRAQKINDDILKFQKSKGKNSSLNKLMDSAFKSLNESEKLNEKAKNLFSETYIYINTDSLATSSAETIASTTVGINPEMNTTTTPSIASATTTTLLVVSSTEPLVVSRTEPLVVSRTEPLVVSRTEPLVVSREPLLSQSENSISSSSPQLSTMSIRDLVKESLDKIKDTYQIFIEMSNLVRKLLK